MRIGESERERERGRESEHTPATSPLHHYPPQMPALKLDVCVKEAGEGPFTVAALKIEDNKITSDAPFEATEQGDTLTIRLVPARETETDQRAGGATRIVNRGVGQSYTSSSSGASFVNSINVMTGGIVSFGAGIMRKALVGAAKDTACRELPADTEISEITISGVAAAAVQARMLCKAGADVIARGAAELRVSGGHDALHTIEGMLCIRTEGASRVNIAGVAATRLRVTAAGASSVTMKGATPEEEDSKAFGKVMLNTKGAAHVRVDLDSVEVAELMGKGASRLTLVCHAARSGGGILANVGGVAAVHLKIPKEIRVVKYTNGLGKIIRD